MSNSYEQIFENNRKWVESKLSQDQDFFTNLAATQTRSTFTLVAQTVELPLKN